MTLKMLVLLGAVAVASPAAAQTLCPDLTISNLQADASVPGGITGTATNTTDHVLMSATVFFNIYDDSGAVIGNAVDQQANLAPGDRWNFHAATAQPYARFKLTSSACVAAR